MVQKVGLPAYELRNDEVVFVGTAVPIRNLFDHLGQGSDLDKFLLNFPTVKRCQCQELLQEAKHQAFEVAQLRSALKESALDA